MSLLKARPSASDFGCYDITRGGKYHATVASDGSLLRGAKLKSRDEVLDAIFDATHQAKPHKGKVPAGLPATGKSKPTGVPQVLVTLTPSGGLKVELPGAGSARRSIELRSGEEGFTLKRILQAQLTGDVEIGLEGGPTAAQVQHWERHYETPGEGCRFCIAEGRTIVQSRRSAAKIIVDRSDCTVRVIPPRGKGRAAPVVIQASSVAELDL